LNISKQAHLAGKRFTPACYNELILRAVFGVVKMSAAGACISPAGAGEFQT
jgi:hypothetical protein